MVIRARGMALAVLSAVTWAAAPGAFAQSPEIARGQALYDARCGLCHDKSVHQRTPRSAKTFAEIRGFVVRWDRELGALWRADELDAVTRYLNDRYYRYSCPASVCGSERAQSGAFATTVPRSQHRSESIRPPG